MRNSYFSVISLRVFIMSDWPNLASTHQEGISAAIRGVILWKVDIYVFTS
jgi:hypothetical protein